MAASNEVNLALRVRRLSSLVRSSSPDQGNDNRNVLALRLSALLDAMEDLVYRQPQLRQPLENGKGGIAKKDPYIQLSVVLDGADDLRKFLSDMERCKILDEHDKALCRRINACAEIQAQQSDDLKQLSQRVLTFLGRYNDYVSRFINHDKVDQISRIFLSLDQSLHRIERQITRNATK